jgi:hypothetical protein
VGKRVGRSVASYVGGVYGIYGRRRVGGDVDEGGWPIQYHGDASLPPLRSLGLAGVISQALVLAGLVLVKGFSSATQRACTHHASFSTDRSPKHLMEEKMNKI